MGAAISRTDGCRPALLPRSFVLVCLALLPSLAHAWPPEDGPRLGPDFRSLEDFGSLLRRDIQVTLRARRALTRDKAFDGMALGVRVEKGVATLWGTVPSEEVAGRAARALENVRGVYEVRSELAFAPPETPGDVLKRLLADMSRAVIPSAVPGPSFRRDLLDRGSGFLGVLTSRPGEPAPEQVFTARPSLPPGKEIERRPAAPGGGVSLLPPVAAFATGADGTRETDVPPAAVVAAVERVRNSDYRFSHVRAEVHDGVVLLRARPARLEAAMELARAVSRLPGVRRVDVRQSSR